MFCTHGPKVSTLIIAAFFVLLTASPAAAKGGHRPKPPAPSRPKPAVTVRRIADRHIEMPAVDLGPDRTLVYAYGSNISNRVITRLMEGGAVRVVTDPQDSESSWVASSLSEERPDPVRLDDPVTAGLELSGEVRELSFDTGEKGDLTYYGFRAGFTNLYNDGADARSRDEFAGVTLSPAFGDTGGLHVGMDLGSEVNIDVFWLGASLKRARYSAHIGVDLQVIDVLTGATRVKRVTGHGEGLFFELVGQYAGYMGGIVAARRAAMLSAFSRVTDSLATAIAAEARGAPLIFYGRWVNGTLYMAGGATDAAIAPGLRFYNRSAFDRGEAVAVVTVDEAFRQVSRLSLPQGGVVLESDLLVSLKAGEQPPQPVTESSSSKSSATAPIVTGDAVTRDAVTVNAGSRDLDPIQALVQYIDNTVGRFLRGLWALVTLPQRLARFLQYDQSFDGGDIARSIDARRVGQLAQGSWALTTLGLPRAWDQLGHGALSTIVAVIDSGVDYNHQELRRNIFFDGSWNAPGYDFFSGDKRPFDDHAHGTAVASAIAGGGQQIVGVAPLATIMPVKVVSPYGYTRSAALYEGVRYALNKGAKIIVMGWATERNSEALREALLLAKERGALVVAAAGDDGVDLSSNPRYPASFAAEDARLDNVLVVAGTARDGRCFANQGPLHLSSNFGGAVALSAPASGVKVASPRNSYATAHYSGIAAGYVAGGAALLWARHTDWNALQVREALVAAGESATSGGASGCGPRLRLDRLPR